MKTIYSLLALISVLFISCDNEPDYDSFRLGQENHFEIKKEYYSIDNSLRFSITEINDSRCPADVICVWEGKADVKIEVKNPVHGILLLNTHNNRIDSLGNYSFELIDVSPYPISTKTINLEEYNISLNILELIN